MRELTEIRPGVLVATSALYATTTTVVTRDGRAVVVDPAWRPAELAGLAAELAARGLEVTAGLSTHAHHDHLLWHPGLGTPPRWASAGSVRMVEEHREDLVRALGEGFPDDLSAVFAQVASLPGDHVPAPFGADSTGGTDEPVEALVHDGHAPGHTAWWFPDREVLLVGDLLSDLELPLPFSPDDLPAYLAGLELLAPYVARARWLVPGHGTPTSDPQARLDADRRYLDAVLAGGDPDDPRRAHEDMEETHQRLRALVADR